MTLPTATIRVGDAREVLATIPDGHVSCVVTSPPYWGLRKYLSDDHPDKAKELGTEDTFDEYLDKLVSIFREVRRVLDDSGTCWVNLGSSYFSRHAGGDIYSGFNSRWSGREEGRTDKQSQVRGSYLSKKRKPGSFNFKPKDLVPQPWLFGLAAQEDGWWIRSEIIWNKPACLPENVSDRPTKSHETILLLTPSERYYYNADAVRQPYADATLPQKGVAYDGHATKEYPDGIQNPSDTKRRILESMERKGGANLRSVWTIPPRPFPGAHFATFPIDIPERCIAAGCPEKGMVLDPFCGAGTTGLAALRSGRSFLGIELNPEYAEMARARLKEDAPLWNQVEVLA